MAQLTGVAHDVAGAVVPKASVKVRNVDTEREFTTLTNGVGGYTFSNLPPGTYELTINAAGFRALTRRGIAISVNIVRREDATLEVGQVTETVAVDAGQVTLQTEKADLHTKLGSKEVVNMPLPRYRNYQSLNNLVSGATPAVSSNEVILPLPQIPCRLFQWRLRASDLSQANVAAIHFVAYYLL